MKKIGIIGGMSWESTVEYYRILNEEVKKRLGFPHSAEILLYSVDFEAFVDMQHRGDWQTMTDILVDIALRLKNAGADMIVIATNTMHKMAPEIEKASGLPLVHIADTAAVEIKRLGLKTVGLLGTKFTMEMDFYKERLHKLHGIEVVIPDAPGRDKVHNIIYEELTAGIINEESRIIYLDIISSMREKGAQGIILGCTEIPLLLKADDCPLPLLNTTKLHALGAVNLALS